MDADHAADPDALSAAGVDLESLILAAPSNATEAWDIVRALSRCGALDLLVVASLNGVLALPGAGWGVGYLERRLTRLVGVLRGRRTAVLVTNQPLPPRWRRGEDGPEAREGSLWCLETVGGAPVARAAALRVALRPAGVRFTPYGDVACLRSEAWVIKHHGSPRGPGVPLEIGPGGPRRAAELVALAEACGCLAHTTLGLRAAGCVLGRTAERAAVALESDPVLAAALEAEIRAAWACAPFPPRG
jgi:hypothetical protein